MGGVCGWVEYVDGWSVLMGVEYVDGWSVLIGGVCGWVEYVCVLVWVHEVCVCVCAC